MPITNFGKSSRGRSQNSGNFSEHPHIGRIVFALAQLSCGVMLSHLCAGYLEKMNYNNVTLILVHFIDAGIKADCRC